MNYLGHAYLSFDSPEILVGNMISDFIKGSARFSFSGNIQKGIALHRMIDEFTDSHAATKKAKEIFRPHYRLYSGPILDVVYDHFLASDISIFNDASLKQFSLRTYMHLEHHHPHLPERFKHVFFYMRTENWLYNYKNESGIRKSLHGLARRAAYIKESDTAFELFMENYGLLERHFRDFFEDVKLFAKEKFHELISKA
jgi:acyl carrier protein phosphodiesterase